MKKRIAAIIIALCLVAIPRAGKAAGMGIGMTTWFVWWKPYFTLSPGESMSLKRETSNNPSFLYGPVLSFYLPKHVTITTTFLYGEFPIKIDEVNMSLNFIFPQKTRYLIKRYDSDSAITYSFARFFSMYLGFKYTKFKFKSNEISALDEIVFYEKIKKQYDEYAPALGFGFTIPLVEKTLYLLFNGSVIFDFVALQGSTTTLAFMNIMPLEVTLLPQKPIKQNMYKIGMNSTLSLAYYVDVINTTFSLGFRYQMFKMLNTDSTLNIKLNKLYDHFYGITAAVIYRVNFPEKKTEGSDSPQTTKK
ncbi:MAG TPA: hypothetical protein PL180_16845 [Spirochaetota bacterium]|nr:hypothetical protein [Spirochaetota bacterium]HPL18357.1 hypothetical protein [Spirochaetota bacterium]HRS79579.1 hypothetical protein [Spirochaetota bacterium]HRT76942.1 hypothetical protein [Spirochaetota bacterium]